MSFSGRVLADSATPHEVARQPPLPIGSAGSNTGRVTVSSSRETAGKRRRLAKAMHYCIQHCDP